MAENPISPTTFTNWSGRFSGPVSTFWEPDTLADLINVVRRASTEGHMLHVVGSGWAFENIAYSPDWMVSLRRLNHPLSGVTDGALNAQWSANQAAGQDMLFHVEAGATIADVNDLLAARGLAMPTLGGQNGQALAGAISTGTHGGDVEIPPFADAVMAMHLVTEGGRELWIERASLPITEDTALGIALARSSPNAELVRNDDIFNALLVAFGRFGVIYSYVLRVVPAFRLAEWTTRIPAVALSAALRAGVTSGTFLAPLLAMLPPPPASLNAINIPSPRIVEVAFDTDNLDMCYVKRRWLTGDPTDLGLSNALNPLCLIGAAGVLTAAIGVLGPFGGIPLYGAAVATEIAILSTSFTANPGQTAGEMLAQALSAFWRLSLGWAIPQLTGIEFGLQYQDSMGAGRRGPSHLIMSGYREQSLQGCYRGDSIEVMFDAHSTGYVDFLDAIVATARNFKQAGWLSLRWSAMSRATLSMHNFSSAHAVAIEVTSLRGLPDNAAWMSFIESVAVMGGGRPHWGQINNLNVTSTVIRFGSNVNAWRSALSSVVGSAITFSNVFTALRGLEPLPGATATLSGQRAGDLAGGVAVVPAISLLLGLVPRAEIYQSDWRWCHKCQSLFFGGNPGSVCPAGGSHESIGSGDYSLVMNSPRAAGQSDWRWCHKCQGLFFGGNPGSVCPAGGSHDSAGNGDYTLAAN
jgi:FAD binding domain